MIGKPNKKIKVFFFGNPVLSPFLMKNNTEKELKDIEEGYLLPKEVPTHLFEHLDGQTLTEKLANPDLDPNGFDFVQVESGQTHTLLLNKRGEVFSFGEGLMGQLGTNKEVI